MSTCSASSNIRSQLFAPIVYQQASGNRIAFLIDTGGQGYTIGSGITGGVVVRYDPNTLSYVPSNAKTPDTAEVVGVVESLSFTAGVTVFTVVANGLMNYPNLDSVPDFYTPGQGCDAQSSLAGGEGGKDVLFLSDGCTGSVQYLEPSTAGAIVKPILQVVKTENYNTIVLNYIGYEVGEAAQAEFPITGLVGSLTYVLPGTTVPFGYIDISSEKLISKTDYTELYSVFGLNYGVYEEEVSIYGSAPGNVGGISIGSTVTQIDGSFSNTGTVVSINQALGRITIRRDAGQPETRLTSEITPPSPVNLVFNGTMSKTPTLPISVTKFTVPSVAPTFVTVDSSTTAPTQIQMVPLIKAKNDLSFVSIVDNLKLQGLSLGTILDVEATLNHLCTQIGGCP